MSLPYWDKAPGVSLESLQVYSFAPDIMYHQFQRMFYFLLFYLLQHWQPANFQYLLIAVYVSHCQQDLTVLYDHNPKR